MSTDTPQSKEIEEVLGEHIAGAILDGQNQIHDLKTGKATDIEVNERMAASYKFHSDKIKEALLSYAKAQREEGRKEADWDAERLQEAYKSGRERGVKEVIEAMPDELEGMYGTLNPFPSVKQQLRDRFLK